MESKRVGLAQIDLSTGDFTLDETSISDLHDAVRNIDPAELLISDKAGFEKVEELKKISPKSKLELY